MSEIQVGSLDDVRISGLNLSITLPNGTVKQVPNGVIALLKGELSILSGSGTPFSRGDILRKVNQQAQAGKDDGDTIAKEPPEKAPPEKAPATDKETQETLRDQVEELKKIRQEMAQEEQKKGEESSPEAIPDSERVDQLVAQLNQAIAAMVPDKPPEVELPELSEDDSGRQNRPGANLDMGSSSSGVTFWPVPDQEEPEEPEGQQGDLFVKLTLVADADSGGEGDLVTKPALEVTTLPNAGITITINGVEYQATADSTGKAVITIGEALTQGKYPITVTVVDGAGHEFTIHHTLVIDTPGADMVGGLDAVGDSGVSTTDGITNADDLMFSGKTEPDTTVTLTMDALGITQTVTSDADGSYHFTTTDPSPIPQGRYDYRITATDQAGNTSARSVTGSVVVDRQVAGFTVGLSESVDSGDRSADGLASVTPTLTGTGAAGTMISLVVSNDDGVVGEPYGPVIVSPDGQWQYTLPEALADGSYTFRFTATDPGGNTHFVEFPVTIDSSVHLTASLTGESDTGTDTTDAAIHNDNPVLSDPGAPWDIVTAAAPDDADIIGPVSDDKPPSEPVQDETPPDTPPPTITGPVTDNIPPPEPVQDETPPDTAPTITITGPVTDHIPLSGQVQDVKPADTAPTVTGEPESDTVASTVASTITAALANDTGFFGDDGSSKNSELSIKTRFSGGEIHTLELLIWRADDPEATPVLAQTVVPGSDATGYTFSTPELADGSYQYRVTATDMAGHSSESGTGQVTVDTQPPALGDVTQEGVVHGTYVDDAHLSFSGSAEPAARVYLVLTKGSDTLTASPVYVEADGEGNWHYTLDAMVAATLMDGTYQWSFLAVDRAGNMSPAQNGSFTLDTVMPVVTFTGLRDAGDLQGEMQTSDQRPVFTGTVTEDAFITVTLTEIPSGQKYSFTTDTAVNDDWALPVTEDLPTGTYTVHVRAADLAGNLSSEVIYGKNLEIHPALAEAAAGPEETSDVDEPVAEESPVAHDEIGTVTHDEVSPVAHDEVSTVTHGADDRSEVRDSVITDTPASEVSDTEPPIPVEITARFDSQTGAGDGVIYSNDPTPTFSGTGAEGDNITLTLTTPDGTAIRFSATVDSDGHWTITVPERTEDGIYQWSVGDDEAPITGSFTLNTRPPELTEAGVVMPADTGFDHSDNITADPAPDFSVAGDAGAEVVVRVWGDSGTEEAPLWTSDTVKIPDSAPVTVPVPEADAFNDGRYTWTVTLTDGAGNETVSAAQPLSILTTAPTVPTLDGMDDGDAHLTNDNTPLLQGSGDEGTRISLEITDPEGTPLTVEPAYVVVDSDGNWRFPLSNVLDDGTYTIVPKAMDAAGNTASGAPTALTIDTVPPVLQDVQMTGQRYAGSVAGAWITNNEHPEFTGSTDKDATVSVLLKNPSGALLHTFTPEVNGATGQWSCKLPVVLSEGSYLLSVNATDGAGNTSTIGDHPLTIHRTAPDLTVLVNGHGSEDAMLTNEPEQTFSGTVGSDTASLALLINGQTINITPGSDGGWSHTMELHQGINNFRVTALDVAGNKSTVQGMLTIKTGINFRMDLASDEDRLPADQAADDNSLAFSGSGDVGDTVALELTNAAGTVVGQTTLSIGSDGQWRYQFTGLEVGDYTLTAHVADDAGNTSQQQGQFTLDAPVTPLTGALSDDNGDGVITHLPTFTGTVEPGDQVRVELTNSETDEKVTVDARVDGDGRWHAEAHDLSGGGWHWTVMATDSNGNTETLTGSDFTYDTTVATEIPTLYDQITMTGQPELLETRVFTGEGRVDSEVTLDIAGKVYKTTADDDGDWVIKAQFRQSGLFDYQLQYQNPAGETVMERGSVVVKAVDFNSLDTSDHSPGSDQAISSHHQYTPPSPVELPPPAMDHFDMEHNQEF